MNGSSQKSSAGPSPESDRRAFVAAIARLREIGQADGVVTKARLVEGFVFEGERVPFINPQQGIFKPARMGCALSILTQYATKNKKVWYDDQLQVHEQIRSGADVVG